MYQDQILNSKYVWNIFVISARFIPLKNYTALSSQPTIWPHFQYGCSEMLSWMWVWPPLRRECANYRNGLLCDNIWYRCIFLKLISGSMNHNDPKIMFVRKCKNIKKHALLPNFCRVPEFFLPPAQLFVPNIFARLEQDGFMNVFRTILVLK